MQDKAKVHGLNDYVIDEVKERGVTLLITPDSSSSDYEYQKKLYDMGVSVLVLDHHSFEEKDVYEHTILINNQDGSVENTSLSGCGVSYKFIKAVADEVGLDIGNKYLDMVSMSLVADVMDMRSLENRYYFNIGSKVENINNLFLKYFIEKQKIEDYLSIEEIGFSLSPLINATIRLGIKSEKDLLFRSLLDRNETVESNKRGSKGELVPIYEEAFRIATNSKTKQNKLRDTCYNNIISKFSTNNEDKVFIEDVGNEMEGTISGLIANKLMGTLNKPVILLRYNKEFDSYMGSARSVNEISQFKDLCKGTNEFEFCLGHSGSFGVSIKGENIDSARIKLNEILKDVVIDNTIEVDAEYLDGIVPIEHIKTISEYGDLWCNTIKEPLFVVKNIKIHTDNIEKVGNATYIFSVGKVKYVKNFGSKKWYENIMKYDDLPFGGLLEVELICKFRKNKKGYYYCEIVEMESRASMDDAIDF